MVQSILEAFSNEGYEAYVVGGYVRDYLLKRKSYDIDITTNAQPDEIRRILNISKVDNYGCILLKTGKYNIEITTYRKDISYKDYRHPVFEFTENILEDLLRRDFTIDAICLDKDLKIYDPLNGVEDLYKRELKTIGNSDKKLSEDAIRILRAIRLMSIYSLDTDKTTKQNIKKYGKLLKNISYEHKKRELDKLFHNAPTKGVMLLKEYDLLGALELNPINEFKPSNLLGCWAQFKFSNKYPFSKRDRKDVSIIQSIIERGIIDNFTFMDTPLELVLTAGEILGIDKKIILNNYANCPLKESRDLLINGATIKRITKKEGSTIKEIKQDLINNIMRGILPNRSSELEEFVIKKWSD